MHDAQDVVTIGDGLGDDADTANVIDTGEGHALALHLAVDAVDVLGPAGNLGLDVFLGQFLPQSIGVALEVGLA